jgi:hypothetical protein
MNLADFFKIFGILAFVPAALDFLFAATNASIRKVSFTDVIAEVLLFYAVFTARWRLLRWSAILFGLELMVNASLSYLLGVVHSRWLFCVFGTLWLGLGIIYIRHKPQTAEVDKKSQA